MKVRGSTCRGTGRMEAKEVIMEWERWNSSSCSDRVVRGPKRTYVRFAQVEFQGEETVPGTFRAGTLNSSGGEDRLGHQGEVRRQQNPAGKQEEKSSSAPHPGSQRVGMSLQLGNGEGIRPGHHLEVARVREGRGWRPGCWEVLIPLRHLRLHITPIFSGGPNFQAPMLSILALTVTCDPPGGYLKKCL